jgi:hypothetical protein
MHFFGGSLVTSTIPKAKFISRGRHIVLISLIINMNHILYQEAEKLPGIHLDACAPKYNRTFHSSPKKFDISTFILFFVKHIPVVRSLHILVYNSNICYVL